MTVEKTTPSCPNPRPAGSDKPPAHHHGFGSRIRNYFLTGLVVAGRSPSPFG